MAQKVMNLPVMWETWVRYLGWEDPLEKEMATHSSILAWRIPWTEEPGGLQSTGSQRVGPDWATFTSGDISGGLFCSYNHYTIRLFPLLNHMVIFWIVLRKPHCWHNTASDLRRKKCLTVLLILYKNNNFGRWILVVVECNNWHILRFYY